MGYFQASSSNIFLSLCNYLRKGKSLNSGELLFFNLCKSLQIYPQIKSAISYSFSQFLIRSKLFIKHLLDYIIYFLSLPPIVVGDFMFYYILNPAPCQITYNIYGFRCYRSSLPQPLQCTLWQQSLFPYAVRVISCIFEFLQNILVNYHWYHLPLKHSILLHTLKCNYCTIKCVNLWLFC